MANKPLVYCDACIFIAFLKGNEIVNDVNRSEICAQILSDAQEERIKLFTSWASLIECPRPNPPQDLGATVIESADQLFNMPYITKINMERFVAQDARLLQAKASGNEGYQNLLKNQNPHSKQIKKMTPFDAVHLASALAQQVDYFFTYDEAHLMPLNRHEIVNGLIICPPCRPWQQQRSIFDEVTQQEYSENGIIVNRSTYSPQPTDSV